MPLFSIITITYNAEKFIERTIKSIVAQTDKNFEYIIIDGASKDKTLEIVNKYKSVVDVLVSEPDKGLYDAMNKGLAKASGDFVWFVNAGDEIDDSNFIEIISKEIDNQTDVIYGDALFVEEDGKIQGLRSKITPHKLSTNLKWQDMKLGMLVCHQSFIARRIIAPKYLDNNLSADVDWEIKCLKSSRKNLFYDAPISKYLVGGISNKQLKRSLIDRFKVLKYHFGLFQTLIAHLQIAIRGALLIIRKGGKYW